jgi:hypothetical protein
VDAKCLAIYFCTDTPSFLRAVTVLNTIDHNYMCLSINLGPVENEW